jgi:ribA/ribD-fused uncharacterized protein
VPRSSLIPTKIDSYRGDWIFLSNFYLFPIEYEGSIYPSVEHAYQAAKTLNLKERMKFTFPGLSAFQAKAAGYHVTLQEGWDTGLKLEVMQELLRKKFFPTVMRRKLLSTFNAELMEGNWWHDTYWGVCDGSGQHRRCPGHEPYGENNLGKLHMEVRNELSEVTRNGY